MLIQSHLADIAIDGNGAAQRLTVGGQRRDGGGTGLLGRDKTLRIHRCHLGVAAHPLVGIDKGAARVDELQFLAGVGIVILDNKVEGGVVEGRLFAGRIAALLADSHLAGSALAPVGDGGDRGLTGAAAGDTAIAVHGSHGGVAAHPDDEVVVDLPAGVKIGFGAGVVCRDLQLHLVHFQLKVRRCSQQCGGRLCSRSCQKQPAQHNRRCQPCDLIHRVALPSFG